MNRADPRGRYKRAAPMFFWPDNKEMLASQIIKCMPKKITNYYEPFAGGASVFFRCHHRIKWPMIYDANFQLMETLKQLKEAPQHLFAFLRDHEHQHNARGADHYYEVRKRFNNGISKSLQSGTERAADYIYINRTCRKRTAVRYNVSEHFTEPYGRRAEPDADLFSEQRLIATSAALANAEIDIKDFHKIRPVAGDVIYCDPPVVQEWHTDYYRHGELVSRTHDDQADLFRVAEEWRRAGAVVIITEVIDDKTDLSALGDAWTIKPTGPGRSDMVRKSSYSLIRSKEEK